MELQKPVRIREVWEWNLEVEFFLIRETIWSQYCYASMDTEFPGVVYRLGTPHDGYQSHQLSPADSYLLMKKNVDALNLIQLGLTLSDANGNLPDFGSKFCFIWQFNFREFDADKDLRNSDSIELLKCQGIDFARNKREGVQSAHFAKLFIESGLLNSTRVKYGLPFLVTWVTFHSTYDFGYLMKVLMQGKLPPDLETFMNWMRYLFGMTVFDMKEMMKYCGLYGGLERTAKSLDVARMAGKSHQAGSDSLLTMQTFVKLKKKYFCGENSSVLNHIPCKIYGF